MSSPMALRLQWNDRNQYTVARCCANCVHWTAKTADTTGTCYHLDGTVFYKTLYNFVCNKFKFQKYKELEVEVEGDESNGQL